MLAVGEDLNADASDGDDKSSDEQHTPMASVSTLTPRADFLWRNDL